MSVKRKKKPDWLKISIPGGERYLKVKKSITSLGLNTVCSEARCPNCAECWDSGTATFMILGSECTRGCAFCSVGRFAGNDQVDFDEPERIARAVNSLELDYAVITSVTRDDLEDGGASVFADTAKAIKNINDKILVELLIPDYTGDALKKVVASGACVIDHNVEVVERLTAQLRHKRFSYSGSLNTLESIKKIDPEMMTKSSLMVGLGETKSEILKTMRDVKSAGVDILVVEQYLQPERTNAKVVEYLTPQVFKSLEERGYEMGFSFVLSAPLARTSYKAAEAFVKKSKLT